MKIKEIKTSKKIAAKKKTKGRERERERDRERDTERERERERERMGRLLPEVHFVQPRMTKDFVTIQ